MSNLDRRLTTLERALEEAIARANAEPRWPSAAFVRQGLFVYAPELTPDDVERVVCEHAETMTREEWEAETEELIASVYGDEAAQDGTF